MILCLFNFEYITSVWQTDEQSCISISERDKNEKYRELNYSSLGLWLLLI